jgi:uncharacterized membrane protein YphA (DoxX/SURF4 family)
LTKYKKHALLIVRLVLGILFLWAAFYKLNAPAEFAQSLENYKVFDERISRFIAVFIPFLEVILGIFLIFGIWLKETFILTVLLYIIFDIMIFQAYLRDLDISCGCFSSSSSSPIGVAKFGENFLLTFLAVFGLLTVRKIIKSENLEPPMK